MPFMLSPPAAAPAPPASPGSRAPVRPAEQDPGQPGSFNEAMARSREAGQEKAAEPAPKPASPKTARRPDDAEKAPSPDSANPMAALLGIPLEIRLAGTATATATTATTASATTASAIATTATAITSAATTVRPGDAATAGLSETPAIPADAGLGKPLAAAAAAPGGLADASGIVVDTPAQPALAASIAAILPKGADLAPVQVQARATAAPAGMPTVADPRAVTARADAASAGLSDAPSGQGDDGLKSAAPALDKPADLSLEATDPAPFAVPGPLALHAGAAPQQPGALAAANAPAPVVSALLTPAVGSPEWGKALGQQVIHLGRADQQVAELQLNPPGLGPLKVTLSINDQQMQAAFVSAHSSVRAAVEASLPQLRALLAESGISLGQTSVGAESQPQTAFSNNQGDSGASPRPGYRGREADKAALLFLAQPAALQRHAGQGLRIDTYA